MSSLDEIVRWKGDYRNRRKIVGTAVDVLITGSFDLSATNEKGLWSGKLKGQYSGNDGSWEGKGVFSIRVDLSINDAGYRLVFTGEGMSETLTDVQITGMFHSLKGARQTVRKIREPVEHTWCDFLADDQRIPITDDTPLAMACVVQIAAVGGPKDNHREQWILLPWDYSGYPEGYSPDEDMDPPFDEPKLRPPFLSQVIESEDQSGGGQLPDPGPAPHPHPQLHSKSTKSLAPEALAINAYLIEDESVEAQVVHFAPDCPALNGAVILPLAISLELPGLVREKAVLAEFGKRPCGTCKRMMAATSARQIARFSDSSSEIVIYDDRIAAYTEDDDNSPLVIRLADADYFTISGLFWERAVFVCVAGEYLFEYNPTDKKRLEEAKRALLRAGLREKWSLI